MLKLALDRENDIRECNASKRAIRAWYSGYCHAKGRGCKVKYADK